MPPAPTTDGAPVMGATAFLRRLLALLGPYRFAALAILVALLIEMGFNGAVPLAFKYLIDQALIPKDRHLLLTLVGALTAGVLLVSLVGVRRDYSASRRETRLV